MPNAPRCVSRFIRNFTQLIASAVVLGSSLIASAGVTEGVTRVVAVRGGAPPNGDGKFWSFSEPSINNLGQVAFVTWFGSSGRTGNPDFGAYRTDGSLLVPLARVGEPLVGGGEPFSFGFDTTVERLGDPALNDLGQIASRGLLGSGGNPIPVYVRTDGVTSQIIIRSGDPIPNGGSFGTHYSQTVGFNDLGQLLFEAGNLGGTSAGSANDSGIYRADGANVVEIVREGATTPDGAATIVDFDMVSLNNLGRASFTAELSGGAANRAIFVSDGATMVQTVRTGQAAPDGNGIFNSVSEGVLNDLGQVLFAGGLTGSAGGIGDNAGLFLSDGGPIVQLARKGQSAGSGGGTFDVFATPMLNDAGQVLFSATIHSTTSSDRGIFLSDGISLDTVARKGQSAPGSGVFTFFRESAFNDMGQAAFNAELTQTAGGSSDNFGLFLYDDELGLIKVAREGEALLGSTIVGLSLGQTFAFLADERSGLNNLGQLAFRFELADGREGVAIWTRIPEPTGLGLLCAALITLACPIGIRTGDRTSASA